LFYILTPLYADSGVSQAAPRILLIFPEGNMYENMSYTVPENVDYPIRA
jgi:hypothetical protein